MHRREQLSALSREDLIDLLCSGDQTLAGSSVGAGVLPPPLNSSTAPPPAASTDEAAVDDPDLEPRRKKRGGDRPFVMSRYGQRWVALRLAYVGTRFCGMQYADEQGVETVEGALFVALIKTRLITNKDECGFSRGGRTDRGVSALGQVVALRLRSSVVPPSPADGGGGASDAVIAKGSGDMEASAAADEALAAAADPNDPTGADTLLPLTAGEMDYVRVINAALPSDVRVISWAAVPPNWSSRFAAKSRTYHYFFTRGSLRVDAMREGARRLTGAHDYRNFCKVDPNNKSFERTVHSFEVRPVDGLRLRDGDGAGPPGGESPFAPWVFVIRGSAFLWHQVRCMVATLFLIGLGKEEPALIDALLDLERHPARPTYDMAPDAPLLLHSIGYPHLRWQPHQEESLGSLAAHWARETDVAANRAAMMHTMRSSLLEAGVGAGGVELGGAAPVAWGELLRLSGRNAPLGDGPARRGCYTPVLKLRAADSVEERAATHQAKKAKKEARDAGGDA